MYSCLYETYQMIKNVYTYKIFLSNGYNESDHTYYNIKQVYFLRLRKCGPFHSAYIWIKCPK